MFAQIFEQNDKFSILNELDKRLQECTVISIGGSVVECSPATRAARVRFPADAIAFFFTHAAQHLNETPFLKIKFFHNVKIKNYIFTNVNKTE